MNITPLDPWIVDIMNNGKAGQMTRQVFTGRIQGIRVIQVGQNLR